MSNSNFIAGGCSFTFGHELSDDKNGEIPSKKTWAYGLFQHVDGWNTNKEYRCVARAGSGNPGIARRVFSVLNDNVSHVVVMWSFLSRYDWAMPRHRLLEDTRWATISPWDTDTGHEEAFRTLANSETQQEQWKVRKNHFEETGVKPFAESIYRHAANEYHEVYLSWKSIIWLQNILEKRKIKYFFTLADNSLFYNQLVPHNTTDSLLENLHKEIDFSNWYFFGERCMGFNQWALLNGYERGTTHPLDRAHRDAVKLMKSSFIEKIT